jgi:hypothetical protein
MTLSGTEVGSERHRFCPSRGTKAVAEGSFCANSGHSLQRDESDVEASDSLQQTDDPTPISGSDTSGPGEVAQPQIKDVPTKASRTRKPFIVLGVVILALFVIGGIAAIVGALTSTGPWRSPTCNLLR